MYAPYVPYITETLYQELYTKEHGASVHITEYASVQAPVVDEQAATLVTHMLALVAAVRKLKSDHALSLKTELQELVLVCPHALEVELTRVAREIQGITRCAAITYARTGTGSMAQRDGQWYATVVL